MSSTLRSADAASTATGRTVIGPTAPLFGGIPSDLQGMEARLKELVTSARQETDPVAFVASCLAILARDRDAGNGV